MSRSEEYDEECDDVKLIKEVVEKLIEARRKVAEALACIDTGNYPEVDDILQNVRGSILLSIDALILTTNKHYREKIRTDSYKTKVWTEIH